MPLHPTSLYTAGRPSLAETREAVIRVVRCILVMALAAGCASKTLTSGAALSTAGKVASSAMKQAAISSPDAIQYLKDSDRLLSSLYGNAAQPQLKQRFALMDSIQKELSLRAAVLESLGETYSALLDLASYDASAAVTTSLTSLVASANAYLKAANSNPIPTDVSGSAPLVAGIVVNLVQQHDIRETSGEIATILDAVIQAMEKYRSSFIGFKEIVTSQSADSATILFGAGFYSVSPLLNYYGGPYGYVAVADADKRIALPQNQRFRAALTSIGAGRTQDRVALVSTAYDQSLSALRKLKIEHEALQNGGTLQLSDVFAAIGELQDTVAKFRTAFSGQTSAGK